MDEGYFNVDAVEMTDEEIDLTCDRLTKFLTASPQDKARLAERYGRGRATSPRLAWLE